MAVEKPAKKLVAQSATKLAAQSDIKSASKSTDKNDKSALIGKKGKAHSEHTENSDSGDTLLKMAKEEMSKLNSSGEDDDKAEKTSKFKPIKVERGNLADEKAKWVELNKRYGKEKAQNYKMSEAFQALKPINHKILGWGFVLTNENDRLEVLFQNGIKMLISNYK